MTEPRPFRVQRHYDELMREGKHGHYETLFRVVKEECDKAYQRGRRDGLEEAAKVAEGICADWQPNEESAESAIRHGKKIAAAIRSLMEEGK